MFDMQLIEIPPGYYYHVLGAYLVFVFLMSLPCGYLRRGYKRLSRPWARTLYIPITVSIILRSVLGLAPGAIPWILGAFLLGLYAGGAVRSRRITLEATGADPEDSAYADVAHIAASHGSGDGEHAACEKTMEA